MRYYSLKNDIKDVERRKYVVNKLLLQKENMKSKIPSKQADDNLLIATWNIRDFNSNKYGHGYRLTESFYFIAQIITSFDLVALQEINEKMDGLNQLMYVLGSNWDYICTDVTEGSGGNGERMAFVYDTRRVSFKKIAGEVVLPQTSLIKGDIQFARTPFVVSFQAGWSKFSLCTVHIYFGSESGAKLERRKSEIEAIAKFLKKRADKDLDNLLVLGDFNIVSPEHDTMKALTSNGFEIPQQIKNAPPATNMFQTKHYDQIGVRSKSNHFELSDSAKGAGAYNFYHDIFTEDDFEHYKVSAAQAIKSQLTNAEKQLQKEMAKTTQDVAKIAKLNTAIADLNAILNPADETLLKEYYFKEWRTFQLSDHIPMYVELKTDHSVTYLKSMIGV